MTRSKLMTSVFAPKNPDFARWAREAYVVRYPTPPRDRRPLTEEEAAAHGFGSVGQDTYAQPSAAMPDDHRQPLP